MSSCNLKIDLILLTYRESKGLRNLLNFENCYCKTQVYNFFLAEFLHGLTLKVVYKTYISTYKNVYLLARVLLLLLAIYAGIIFLLNFISLKMSSKDNTDVPHDLPIGVSRPITRLKLKALSGEIESVVHEKVH